MIDVIIDTLLDTLKLLPFLYLTYLLMEFLEHKSGGAAERWLTRSGQVGPLLGSAFGILPQCGFSASCSNLYATGLITEGTLIAVFIATSDEAIPLLIANESVRSHIWKFLIVKIVFGILIGFMVDLMLKALKIKKQHVELCEDCGCEEEGGILKPAIKHTLKTTLFILIVSFILGLVMEFVGEDILHKVLLTNSYAQPFVAGLLGLIPNCSVSVALIELYTEGVLSFGATCAGLCSGAGIGLAVLFKTNKSFKENMRIVGILYASASLIGFFLMLFGIN